MANQDSFIRIKDKCICVNLNKKVSHTKYLTTANRYETDNYDQWVEKKPQTVSKTK